MKSIERYTTIFKNRRRKFGNFVTNLDAKQFTEPLIDKDFYRDVHPENARVQIQFQPTALEFSNSSVGTSLAMLTESFVVSTLDPERPKNTTITGIHLHEFQPIPALKTTFKKSSTNRDCLAVGPSHIFAAQVDKAVVHVYNRERCNQEAVVPFPEKIHSIALAGEDSGAGTLILGTEGGRVILWEVSSTVSNCGRPNDADRFQ